MRYGIDVCHQEALTESVKNCDRLVFVGVVIFQRRLKEDPTAVANINGERLRRA